MSSYPEASYVIDEVLSGIGTTQITGVPPQNLTVFTVVPGDTKITVNCSAPADTIIDGQTICTVKGVKILRKTGSASISPEDGTLIADIPAGTLYSADDENLINGVTYYYTAYPYSDHDVYNYNKANSRSATPTPVKYWAFDQNFADKNPATTITYPSGFQNSNFEKMLTNEGTGTATAGGWGPFLEETLKNYPAMVNADGTMYKQLNPDDYTKYLDGTAAPYNANTYYAGAYIKKIYTHEEYSSDGESREVQFADGASDGFTPKGFVDFEMNELNGVWIPMGYMDANGKTVISGTTPCASKTADQENSRIKGFSSRGVFLGGAMLNLLTDLEYMLFKSTDIQLQAGHGRCNAGSQKVIANAVVTNGNVRGWKGTNNKTTMNKYFHSQLLGSYQQYIRDPYAQLIGGVLYVDPYYRYAVGATNKINTGITWGANSGQYPSHMVKVSDEFGSFPKYENTGTSATGLCDGISGNASGTRVSSRLGTCDNDLLGGPSRVNLNNEASVVNWNFGVGLMLLPPAGYEPDLEQVD